MTARSKTVRIRKDAQRGQSLRVQGLVRRFPSPACDSSGKLWMEEASVIKRMMLGQKLVCDRHYISDGDCYAVSWYWSVEPKGEHRRWYPNQYDAPVMRLIGRQIIRPVTCGGGYTQMEFTKRAGRVLGAPNDPSSATRPPDA